MTIRVRLSFYALSAGALSGAPLLDPGRIITR